MNSDPQQTSKAMLFKILASPVTLPIKGAFSVMQAIHDQAIEQFSSPDAIKAELVRLEALLDAEDITEEEFEEAEDVLLDRLEAALEAQSGRQG